MYYPLLALIPYLSSSLQKELNIRFLEYFQKTKMKIAMKEKSVP